MKTLANTLVFILCTLLVWGQEVECDASLLFENQTFTGVNDVEQASDFIRAGNNVDPNSTNGNVIVSSGAEVFFQAANEITLEPGFEANSGSLFVAYLDACSENPCPPDDDATIGSISVNVTTNTEYEYELEITAPQNISEATVKILNPEPGFSFVKTLSKANNDFNASNIATVGFPLFPKTSVCGDYNIEVKSTGCGQVNVIYPVTFLWDRWSFNNGNPTLTILNTPMSCATSTGCFLEIEASRATDITFSLYNNSGQVIQGPMVNSTLKEELNKQVQLFDLASYGPQTGKLTRYFELEGPLWNNCQSDDINIDIEVNYDIP
jgi:hypothetical protein